MRKQLKIVQIDVRQGESTLILVSEDRVLKKSVLIDGGVYSQGITILQVLKSEGVEKLDVVINTHYDADHLDGLRYLINHEPKYFENTQFYDRGIDQYVHKEQKFLFYKDAIENLRKVQQGIDWVTEKVIGEGFRHPFRPKDDDIEPEILVGETFFNLGEPEAPELHCIAANQSIAKLNRKTKEFEKEIRDTFIERENASSLGFLIEFGNFTYYTAGDLETGQEDYLMHYINQVLATKQVKQVSAIKASHHGSKNSTSNKFLMTLKPKVILISCGEQNDNYPPQPELLERLLFSHTRPPKSRESTLQVLLTANPSRLVNTPEAPATINEPQFDSQRNLPLGRVLIAGAENETKDKLAKKSKPGHIWLEMEGGKEQFSVSYYEQDSNKGEQITLSFDL